MASASRLRPLATFGGMICFISALAAYPRITVMRSLDATTITYKHREAQSFNPPPADRGTVISPKPIDKTFEALDIASLANEWIFDTGATSHVCCNAKFMHSTTSFANSALAQAVSHFGPNPVPVRGMGDVTFDLPPSTLSTTRRPVMTVGNVQYIPEGRVNLISWSQLKQARGPKLTLREGKGGELEIWEDTDEVKLMTFVLKGGLYFLVQADSGNRKN